MHKGFTNEPYRLSQRVYNLRLVRAVGGPSEAAIGLVTWHELPWVTERFFKLNATS